MIRTVKQTNSVIYYDACKWVSRCHGKDNNKAAVRIVQARRRQTKARAAE